MDSYEFRTFNPHTGWTDWKPSRFNPDNAYGILFARWEGTPVETVELGQLFADGSQFHMRKVK